ncbi:MAG: hypothetical protein ACREQ5_12625, partial [Candidatus Dormibacteria bacterium]
MAEGLGNFIRGTTTDYQQTPNGPIPVKRKRSPGEFARAILGSALSLAASGVGGMEAQREGRPYVQNPNTSVGAILNAQSNQNEQQAQKQFENQQSADQMTLLKHKNALEQQEGLAKVTLANDEHKKDVASAEMGVLDRQAKRQENMDQQQTDWSKALAMPGAEVMKDSNGGELSFLYLSHADAVRAGDSTAMDAQTYALKHPEVVHGSTDGNSKFGTLPVINPATGQYQIIDYPVDQHTRGIMYFGQKRDAHGNPMFDKDGNPIPGDVIVG